MSFYPYTCQPDFLKYMDKFLSVYRLMQFIANILQLIVKSVFLQLT